MTVILENCNEIIASFSGGKTSAYMTIKLKEIYQEKLRVVFMNTGLEHNDTLDFVDKCDKVFGLNVEWIEAVVNHKKRVPTSFRYVNYETATRDSSIAKQVVMKYGLFGVGYLHCTREMKLRPFEAWVKANNLNEVKTAIGIRSDEADRMNENYEKLGLFYPLIKAGVTKSDVNAFWENQPFNLVIPERYGNCVMCWKKSERKIISNVKEREDWCEDIRNLEQLSKKGASKMFRGNNSIDDLVKQANINLDLFDDVPVGNCSESCDVFHA